MGSMGKSRNATMDDQDPMNHDPLAQIKEQLSQCNDLLRTGEIGAALQLLDSIKMPSEEDRKFLRINMLHAADLPVQAYEELKTLSRSPAPNPEALLLLALVCANAGADIDAENFLRAILNEPLLRSSIEKAIATALQIRSNDLALHFENRVLEEDPATDQARQIRWYRALTQGDFIRAVGNISAQDHRLREPLYALQMALVDTNPPDYTKALSACNDCPRGTAVPGGCRKAYPAPRGSVGSNPHCQDLCKQSARTRSWCVARCPGLASASPVEAQLANDG